MNFYSFEFFFFSLIILAVFFLTPVRFRWFVLLAVSCYFYASYKISYLVIILFCTLSAYFAALAMNRQATRYGKKLILILALVVNLGILFVFKYFDFLDASLKQLLGFGGITYTGHALGWLVPIGVSFYVFQIVSYCIDVYRGNTLPEKHLGIFALYVSFFPKLLSGPIERAESFLPQLRENTHWDAERLTNGLKLICWGLFKKLVVADRLAAFVNVVYANPASHAGPALALAVLFYSFQIYCDFSGYTDIAIGLAQMFGLNLTDNFNRPYSATSVGDFWRRWHISLSSWLRDYLYIPLGGNRVSAVRLYGNYLLILFICGLWHGAGWTFAAWGVLHGFYLVCGRFFSSVRSRWTVAIGLAKRPVLHRAVKILTTFILISVAWVFFRADSFSDAFHILTHLHMGWDGIWNAEGLTRNLLLTGSLKDLLIAIGALIFFGLVHKLERHEQMRRMLVDRPLWLRFAVYYILVAGILLLKLPDPANSIYFQF